MIKEYIEYKSKVSVGDLNVDSIFGKINEINKSIDLPTIKQEAHTKAVGSPSVQTALRANQEETTTKIKEAAAKLKIDNVEDDLIVH